MSGKVSIEPGPFVVPMPAALAGSLVKGSPNFMPAAFLGIMNYDPPIAAAGLSPTTTPATASRPTKLSVSTFRGRIWW